MKRRLKIGIARHAGRHAAPVPREAASFWEDFRARAAMTPQAAPPAPIRTAIPAWAWAAVSALAAVAVGISVWRGSLPPPLSPAILSLSAADRRSVFILRDDATAAVIVWVADDSAADPGSERP